MKLDFVRREYRFNELSKKSCQSNPVLQFQIWLKEAFESRVKDPSAMTLGTIGSDGYPQSRVVLLKHFDDRGFIFFTNYNSQKGHALQQNPKATLSFYWPELERQIRITGIAEKTSRKESEDYFKSRPITSQIAAIVSNQSEEVPGREYLENQYFDMEDELHGRVPECPEHWGGYLIRPIHFEFWQGRESRLHDRITYQRRNDKEWIKKRLAP